MVKTAREQAIIDALEAGAAARGIDLVDVEIVGATKAPCIRVRIDNLDGAPITLDEVAEQTGWVSDRIDELDPINGSYTLEVSSPGMARPLRRPADFARFEGSEVELSTTATQGRRNYLGRILTSDDQGVTLELDGGERADIAYDEMKKCTLRPVYDFKGLKEGN